MPVFINDSKALQTRHPEVRAARVHGRKIYHFPNIVIDQAHEQIKKLVKIDGGAVDILLSNNSALTKWMVAGPEIADTVKAFRINESEDKESTMKIIRETISEGCRRTFQHYGR